MVQEVWNEKLLVGHIKGPIDLQMIRVGEGDPAMCGNASESYINGMEALW